jgi:hypothetical protein
VFFWIPAFARITTVGYLSTGVILRLDYILQIGKWRVQFEHFIDLIGSGARHFSLKP